MGEMTLLHAFFTATGCNVYLYLFYLYKWVLVTFKPFQKSLLCFYF